MTRHNIVFCLVLLFLAFAAPAKAADEKEEASAPLTQGGLICFTVTPPADIPLTETCNSLCAKKGAACTGVNSHYSSIQSCEDNVGVTQSSCRCCKGARP